MNRLGVLLLSPLDGMLVQHEANRSITAPHPGRMAVIAGLPHTVQHQFVEIILCLTDPVLLYGHQNARGHPAAVGMQVLFLNFKEKINILVGRHAN